VNTSFSGCDLRIFFTQRNYMPFVVAANMTFRVENPDFGKARIRVVNYTLNRIQTPLGIIGVSHNRTKWTIGQTYSIAPISTTLRAVSNDSAEVPLTQAQLEDVQYTLKRTSRRGNGFFIKSNSGEISGTSSDTVSTSTAELRATHPDFLDGVVATITIQSLYADTDSRSVSAVGPNGRDCDEARQRVDGVEYDDRFTCNCTGFINGGDNCDVARSAVGHRGGENDSTVSTTVISVATVLVVLIAVFAGVQLYQKRRAYWELMKPVDFQPHLQRLAGAGIVAKVNNDKPPRELERKTILLEVELGSGNFGEVWKGTWLEEGKRSTTMRMRKSSSAASRSLKSLASQRVPVAVKTLKNETPAGNDEFLREASVTWQFNHENVVKMYGVVTCGTPYLLVLELCAQGELKGYLEQGDTDDAEHYSLGRLFHFLVGIAEGMKHLIECGYVASLCLCLHCLLSRMALADSMLALTPGCIHTFPVLPSECGVKRER
jgi:hypothetical protein